MAVLVVSCATLDVDRIGVDWDADINEESKDIVQEAALEAGHQTAASVFDEAATVKATQKLQFQIPCNTTGGGDALVQTGGGDALVQLLDAHNLGRLQMKLRDLGAEIPADLLDLDEDSLRDLSLRKLERTRLQRIIAGMRSDPSTTVPQATKLASPTTELTPAKEETSRATTQLQKKRTRTVLVIEPTSQRIKFILAPILETLAIGFRAGEEHHRYTTKFIQPLDSIQELLSGDIVIGIGQDRMSEFKEAAKLAKARGVRVIYYNTEPNVAIGVDCGSCRCRPIRIFDTFSFGDELWDYSHSNLKIFRGCDSCKSTHVTFRYLPPGFIPETWKHGSTNKPAASNNSDTNIGWVGKLRCQEKFGSWLLSHWQPHSCHTSDECSRVFRSHAVWGSIHQTWSCGERGQNASLESFRLSQLLSAKRIVVSELSDLADMDEFKGEHNYAAQFNQPIAMTPHMLPRYCAVRTKFLFKEWLVTKDNQYHKQPSASRAVACFVFCSIQSQI
jgi:hypothetical protein